MRAVIRTAVCLLALASSSHAQTICDNRSGEQNGRFFMLWRDTGAGCLTLEGPWGYATRWSLGATGNLVAGVGWAAGAADRVVSYTALGFEPGSNGYLSLYGWSTDPLVEYYVVDDYGDFVPPGPGATYLGEFQSDGGRYRIYRKTRVDAPSIRGTATFTQYWSVRTTRRPLKADTVITFANHVAAWRAVGLTLGPLAYQIVATEGFASTGASHIRIRP